MIHGFPNTTTPVVRGLDSAPTADSSVSIPQFSLVRLTPRKITAGREVERVGHRYRSRCRPATGAGSRSGTQVPEPMWDRGTRTLITPIPERPMGLSRQANDPETESG